jgi:hypothetical protein
MRLRVVALSFLLLMVACERQKSGERGEIAEGGGHNFMLANWVIQLSMDPQVAGQCLQMAAANGGAAAAYPTFVPVHAGDHITWTSTYSAAGKNIVYFPNGGSPDYPGTPMYNRSTGNWVRAFTSGDSPLGTAATLTKSEGDNFTFTYSQVVVLDPNHNPAACQYPDPRQGMGVHVDQ